MPKIEIKNRDKLIICGLFLAKFDTLAYKSLGFSSFIEAFNVLGLPCKESQAILKIIEMNLTPILIMLERVGTKEN
ncbi:hypothetical protein R1O88_001274 [Campylobacter upsaliensis]|nr:hypothetical protein [Campylobacter upsaliensis]